MIAPVDTIVGTNIKGREVLRATYFAASRTIPPPIATINLVPFGTDEVRMSN